MQETQETRVISLDQDDALEEEMATHYSILAWKIPWTEKPGRLQLNKHEHTCPCIWRQGRDILGNFPSFDLRLAPSWHQHIFAIESTLVHCQAVVKSISQSVTLGKLPFWTSVTSLNHNIHQMSLPHKEHSFLSLKGSFNKPSAC